MDEQGHGTEQWKSLEHRALDEILKIVELRDGRTMNGSSDLTLADIVGKKLRLRYEVPQRKLRGSHSFLEQGTFILMITSVQARDIRYDAQSAAPVIVFGVAPYVTESSECGSLMVQAVSFRPVQSESITRRDINVWIRGDGSQRMLLDSRQFGLYPENLHVLWD
jgi:hypothetical protein